jgi:hypothetical protein
MMYRLKALFANLFAMNDRLFVFLYSNPLISPTINPEIKKKPSAADIHIPPLPVKYCQADG